MCTGGALHLWFNSADTAMCCCPTPFRYLALIAVAAVDKQKYQTTTELSFVAGTGFNVYIAGYKFVVFEARTALTTDPCTTPKAQDEQASDLDNTEEALGLTYVETDLAVELPEKFMGELQILRRRVDGASAFVDDALDDLDELADDLDDYVSGGYADSLELAATLNEVLVAARSGADRTDAVRAAADDAGDLGDGEDDRLVAMKLMRSHLRQNVVARVSLLLNHTVPALEAAVDAVALSETAAAGGNVTQAEAAVARLAAAASAVPDATTACLEALAADEERVADVRAAGASDVAAALDSALQAPLRSSDVAMLERYEAAKSQAEGDVQAVLAGDAAAAALGLDAVAANASALGEFGDYAGAFRVLATQEAAGDARNGVASWAEGVRRLHASVSTLRACEESSALPRVSAFTAATQTLLTAAAAGDDSSSSCLLYTSDAADD